MIRIRTLQIGLAILATAFTAGQAAGQGDVVGDHIRAIGGEEALSAVKTVKRTAAVDLGGMIGEFSGDYVEVILVGKKAYTKSDFGGSVDETGWNGAVGWKRDTEGLRKIEGEDLELIRSQVDLSPVAAINRQFGRAAFVPREDEMIDGVKCHVLGIVGEDLVFYIEAESKMLKAVKSPTEDPSFGGESTIVISFSDYAEFGGVMMAGRMKFDIGDGAITLDFKFEKTELNVTLDESIFEMPAN